MSRPCWNEHGYCILIDHWEGCWKHGHEQPDESKCPKTPGEVDAIWDKICDRWIARGRRRDARRTSEPVQSPDD